MEDCFDVEGRDLADSPTDVLGFCLLCSGVGLEDLEDALLLPLLCFFLSGSQNVPFSGHVW